MKIGILSRNLNLYSTISLLEAGERLGHEIKVIDYGTEFGFSCDDEGVKEVHVFDGDVSVEGGAVGEVPRHFLKGNGIRVGKKSAVDIVAADAAFNPRKRRPGCLFCNTPRHDTGPGDRVPGPVFAAERSIAAPIRYR